MTKKILFGQVLKNGAPDEVPAENFQSEQPGFITVDFAQNETVRIDQRSPLADTWMQKIAHQQELSRPLYVETDDKNTITAVEIPEASMVWNIEDTGKGAVLVTFQTATPEYLLRREHPQFESMLAALQTARTNNEPILVTSISREFEIIDVRPLPEEQKQLYFSNEQEADPAPPGKPVSRKRADELFDLLLKRSCIPCGSTGTCIPFRYPPNGCWVRAHLMSYFLVSQGETPEKIWSGGKLQAWSDNVPECSVKWSWHVAATLLVQEEGGPVERLVLDPSLYNKLLTPEEWKALQTDPNATLTISPWTQYNFFGGTATLMKANSDMTPFRIDLDDMCRQSGPSPYAQCERKE